jgi:NitT/TauT family transport system substrate-binding protein
MRKALIGATVLLGIVLSILLIRAPRILSRKVPLRPVTIAQAGDFYLYAPLYVAKDAGFFTAHGIDVTIVSTGGDDKTWSAVTSGSAQFGVADPTFVAVSAQRGQPGRVIASIVNGVPFWGITLDASIQPFTNAKDISGHTIATFPSPSTAFALQSKMFSDAGLPPNIRQGAFGTLITMLRANQADIALELEPNVSASLKSGAHVVYSMRTLYGDFAITGLTTTPPLLKRDPILIDSVVCSLQQSLDFIRINQVASARLLSRRFPDIPLDVATAALARITDERIVPETLRIDPAAWDKAIALRRSTGDLKISAPYSEFVDMTSADKASSKCHRKPQ